jgi:hypothetical protein
MAPGKSQHCYSESNVARVSPVIYGASRFGGPACISVRPTLDWRHVVHALFAALCFSFAVPVIAHLIV